MPQITLECSDNIIEKDMVAVLTKIHQILCDKLPTELINCKSRVLRHQQYLIADGNTNHAFVHLSIGVLKGRTQELLNAIAEQIMYELKAAFSFSLAQLKLQLSIAISDLPDIYLKHNVQ